MCWTSVLSALALIAALTTKASASCRPSARLIYQFPGSSWLENIAVRTNGYLLLTSIDYPGSLWSLNPFDGTAPVLVATPTPWNSTLGIVEGKPDVFYFIAGNFNLGQPIGFEKGSATIWRADFNMPEPSVEQFITMPEADFLNGLTKFNDTLLLASDSKLGLVWGINTDTGSYSIIAKDPLMAPPPSAGYQEGINGLKFLPGNNGFQQGGTLFFTTSQRYLYSSIELGPQGLPLGPAEFIASPGPEDGTAEINWDDFALDAKGTAFIATELGNSVQRVTLDGVVDIIAGGMNSTTLAEPSSAAFGRTKGDSNTLYIATTGGLAYPVYVDRVPTTIGAQVVALDLDDACF
jgi:hypothetical protein